MHHRLMRVLIPNRIVLGFHSGISFGELASHLGRCTLRRTESRGPVGKKMSTCEATESLLIQRVPYMPNTSTVAEYVGT